MSSIFTGEGAVSTPSAHAVAIPARRSGIRALAQTASLTTRVWQRHWGAFMRVWHTESAGILGEPIFALAAFGAGLGFYLKTIGGVEYSTFVAPGLVAGYAMFGATFDTTFGAYMRMMNHRTFESILATPITIRELVMGEIVWGATRATLSAGGMLLMAVAYGFIREPAAVLMVPYAILVGLVFASISLTVVALVPAMSTLNTYFTLFVAPMFFLSGTFFPTDNLPGFFRAYAQALPLTHGTTVLRGFATGEFSMDMVWATLVLLAYLAVFGPLAVWLMRRRIVK